MFSVGELCDKYPTGHYLPAQMWSERFRGIHVLALPGLRVCFLCLRPHSLELSLLLYQCLCCGIPLAFLISFNFLCLSINSFRQTEIPPLPNNHTLSIFLPSHQPSFQIECIKRGNVVHLPKWLGRHLTMSQGQPTTGYEMCDQHTQDKDHLASTLPIHL